MSSGVPVAPWTGVDGDTGAAPPSGQVALPLWFGPAISPLFGVLHAPEDGRVRGSVLVCPPTGRDYLHAHYALRLLAESIAAKGFLVLRFDYACTGDSAGSTEDPQRVAAWQRSVTEGAAFLRQVDDGRLALVGMRIGATLAARWAVEDGRVDLLALWDPVMSGAAFLAEQRVLGFTALRHAKPRPDGELEVPGVVLPSRTVRDLRALQLSRLTAPVAREVLVVSRPDRDVAALRAHLEASKTDWWEDPELPALMDLGPPYHRLPQRSIADISAWFASRTPETFRAVTLPTADRSATVATTPDGRAVRESILAVGPSALFGIRTEPAGWSSGPCVVLVNVANEHRVGPGGRMWVDLARQWAGLGLRSLRIDVSGVGDSPTRRPGQRQFVARSPEAFEDLADACAAAVSAGSETVILVGLCSSAYQALESSVTLRPRAVAAVNPVLIFNPPEIADHGVVDPRRRIAIPRRSAVARIDALISTAPRTGVFASLRRLAPGAGTHAIALMEALQGLAVPRRRRPVSTLQDIVDGGTSVLLVCGDREMKPLRLGATRRSWSKLSTSPRFSLEYVPHLEHALLASDDRALVTDLLTSFIRSHSESVAAQDPLAAPANG